MSNNNEEPFDVEKETTPELGKTPEPVVDPTPAETEPTEDRETVGDQETEETAAYDPAVTPAPGHDKKPLSTGWVITGILLIIVVIIGAVAFVVSSVNDTNESRDAITGLKLDSLGLSVVEDSIDGNHFLVSGEDSASGTKYFAHCELEKYNLGGEATGLVFCENSFLSEVSLDGEN